MLAIGAGDFVVVSCTRETAEKNKWDEDRDLGLSSVIFKTLPEAQKCFNSTINQANTFKCKLKLTVKYTDANGGFSETHFILAHFDKYAKSLERFVEKAREWSDNPKNPFEQTVYVNSLTNSRVLVSDVFKPTGRFVTEPEEKKIKL